MIGTISLSMHVAFSATFLTENPVPDCHNLEQGSRSRETSNLWNEGFIRENNKAIHENSDDFNHRTTETNVDVD